MEQESKKSAAVTINPQDLLDKALKVIKTPTQFFREMPKSGGFIDPLVFVLAVFVVFGLVHAVVGLFQTGIGGLITGIIFAGIAPFIAGIFSFVAAGVAFIIWKIMGSNESYETAYRSMAYASAISPFTLFLGILIPYLGIVLIALWSSYLYITISIETHKIKPKVAWAVFGSLCGIMILIGVSAQYASKKLIHEFQSQQADFRQFEKNMKSLEKQYENSGDDLQKKLEEINKQLEKQNAVNSSRP